MDSLGVITGIVRITPFVMRVVSDSDTSLPEPVLLRLALVGFPGTRLRNDKDAVRSQQIVPAETPSPANPDEDRGLLYVSDFFIGKIAK